MRPAEEIFLDAAGLEGSQRDAFLASACAGDPATLRRVQDLLEEENRADAAIRSCIGNEAADSTARLRIGPYGILRILGQGGMGTVFLACRDDDQYQQEVAIKVARASAASPEGLTRFRLERQILARLEHPHVARLLDGGTTVDGEPYIVMEFIDGQPVTTYCREQELPPRQRLELFRKIAGAVSYAHQHLVVHRDLKPSNILVTSDGEPRLVDFGIAKLLGDSGPQTATLAFTPGYSSPEQLAGGVVTVATDVYSLGLVLYELLESRPYRGAGDAAEYSAATRGDLEAILTQALRVEPAARYPSVSELSDDIQRYLECRPVRAHRPGAVYRAGKFLRRYRGAAAAALLLLAAVGGGWYFTARQARRTEERFTQVRQLTNALIFDLHDRILDLPGSTTVRERLLATAQTYLAALESDGLRDRDLRAEIAAGYERLADVQGGVSMASLGRPFSALENYRHAWAIRRELAASGEARALRAAAQIGLKTADVLVQTGQTPAALEHYAQALRQAQSALAQDEADPENYRTLALAHYRSGESLLRRGITVEALQHPEAAMRVVTKLQARYPGDASDRALVMAHLRLGAAYQQTGRLDAALAEFRRARQLVDSLAGGREPVMVRLALASLLGNPYDIDMGQPAAGLNFAREALALVEERVQHDPRDAGARIDLALSYSRLGSLLREIDPVESAKVYQQSITLLEARLRDSPGTLDFERRLAMDLAAIAHPLQRRNPLEAVRRARRAVGILEDIERRDPLRVACCSDIPIAALALGDAWRAADQPHAAHQAYEQSLQVAGRYFRQATCDLFCTRDYTNALERLGMRDRALEAWENWAARHGSGPYVVRQIRLLKGWNGGVKERRHRSSAP